MKGAKLLLILIISSLYLFSVGCQEEGMPLEPEYSSNLEINELNKKNRNGEYYSVSKLITVENGGKIKLKSTLSGLTLGKKIKVSAEIKFPPNILVEDTEVTLSIDPSNGMLSLSPPISFLDGEYAPIKISVKGINLKKIGIQKEEIKFTYLDEDDNLLFYESDKIWVKKKSFGVKKASIPHLSTFGFTFVETPDDDDGVPPPLPTRFGLSK